MVLALLGVATALAATAIPKPGYHHQTVEIENFGQVNVISMYAAEDATLLISGTNVKCQDDDGNYNGFTLKKPVDASTGKFEFDGKGFSSLPGDSGKVKVHLKGRFPSSKHAKGSFKLEGCDGKTKFRTDYSPGG